MALNVPTIEGQAIVSILLFKFWWQLYFLDNDLYEHEQLSFRDLQVSTLHVDDFMRLAAGINLGQSIHEAEFINRLLLQTQNYQTNDLSIIYKVIEEREDISDAICCRRYLARNIKWTRWCDIRARNKLLPPIML